MIGSKFYLFIYEFLKSSIVIPIVHKKYIYYIHTSNHTTSLNL
jgi:hypothetical protein